MWLSGHGFKPWRTQTKTLIFGILALNFGFELNVKGWGKTLEWVERWLENGYKEVVNGINNSIKDLIFV